MDKRKVSLVLKQQEDIDFPVKDFLLDLAPYQKVGASFVVSGERRIIADPCGAGKTAESLGGVQFLYEYGDIHNVLVVSIIPSVDQWVSEVQKFLGLSAVLYRGAPKQRASKLNRVKSSHGEIVVANYEMVRNDVNLICEIDWDVVILDEATTVKNMDSKLYSAVFRVTEGVRYIWPLTATPIMNNLLEAYACLSIMRCTEDFGNFKQFVDHFVERELRELSFYNRRFGRQDSRTYWQVVGHKNVEEFRELFEPYYIRRGYDVVGKYMPELVTKDFWLPMSGAQRSYDKELVALARKQHGTIDVMGTMTRRLRLCDGLYAIKDHPKNDSPKLDFLVEQLTGPLEDQQVVVFTSWIDSVNEIISRLTFEGIECSMYTGQNPQNKDRLKELKKFQDGESRVIVGTVALAQSLNLQNSGVIVLYSHLWNPKMMEQIVGRIRRFSSDFKVAVVLRLFMEDSYEVSVYDTQRYKSELAADVFQEEDQILSSLVEGDVWEVSVGDR